MNKLTRYQNISRTAGTICVVLCCFFTPISTSLMGATALLALAFWLLNGGLFALPRLMASNASVLLSTLLILLLAIGVLYSPVPLQQSLEYVTKYRKLLYFAVVISLLKGNDGAARLAEDSFVAGCIVLLALSYGIYFSLIPCERFGFSIVHHITHSLFMSLLAFWCVQRLFQSRQYVYLWLSIFILTTINLFYITPGRTGMSLYIVLMLLAIVQKLRWKHALLSIVGIIAVLGLAYMTSENFSSRTKEAIIEVKTYQPKWSRTSLGMRFDWLRNSRDLIMQKPLFGHGTGAFEFVQDKLTFKVRDHSAPTDNPHNEYMLLAVQIGLVGLFVFLALLISLIVTSFRLPPEKRYLLQGVVLSMTVGCLMNSFLFDTHSGHFFIILSAVLSIPAVKTGSLYLNR
jgi:O-antigen ligase